MEEPGEQDPASTKTDAISDRNLILKFSVTAQGLEWRSLRSR